MKKELIGLDNLEHFLCKTENRIYVDNAAVVLTPGAKDELAKRHVEIVYGPCPFYASCGHQAPAAGHGASADEGVSLEALVYGIAASIKQEHGVADPDQLREMTRQVLEKIKGSL
jgi:hypothetical protein